MGIDREAKAAVASSVCQGPGKEQMVHSSMINEEGLMKGLFTNVLAGVREPTRNGEALWG